MAHGILREQLILPFDDFRMSLGVVDVRAEGVEVIEPLEHRRVSGIHQRKVGAVKERCGLDDVFESVEFAPERIASRLEFGFRFFNRQLERIEHALVARPVRFDQGDPAVRQCDTWDTDFEMARMLKEIQMPVALDLGVVNRMPAFNGGIGEAAARNEVDVDGQVLPSGIEIDAFDVSRIGNTESGFKDWVLHRSSTTVK
mgnify:CR=1 FL=1